jgi:hypothetical protein
MSRFLAVAGAAAILASPCVAGPVADPFTPDELAAAKAVCIQGGGVFSAGPAQFSCKLRGAPKSPTLDMQLQKICLQARGRRYTADSHICTAARTAGH